MSARNVSLERYKGNTEQSRKNHGFHPHAGYYLWPTMLVRIPIHGKKNFRGLRAQKNFGGWKYVLSYKNGKISKKICGNNEERIKN